MFKSVAALTSFPWGPGINLENCQVLDEITAERTCRISQFILGGKC